MRRVVVVGASAAGLAAAETLRRAGHDDPLTLVGDEPHVPYDRPPLSGRILSGAWPAGRLPLRRDEDLDALDLDLRLGTAATGLDLADRAVRLADGSRVPYDGPIVATGVRPRRLPGEGAHVLRTVDDALALRDVLTPGTRLVVVGAGFLGTEVAAVARGLGVRVTLLEPSPVPLAHAVGTGVGGMLSRLHRGHGVELRTSVTVTEVTEDGVRLAGGEVVEADEILVAAGSLPNTGWLADSGLALGDGVVCDAYCEAAPGVYAAGDVARWHHPLFGTSMRIEHRTNAAEQGAAAARNLLAPPQARTPFAPVPYFWSDQYGLRIQAYGHLRGHDEVAVVAGDTAGWRFVAAYRRGGRLTGVLAVSMPPGTVHAWRQAVADGTPWHEAVPDGAGASGVPFGGGDRPRTTVGTTGRVTWPVVAGTARTRRGRAGARGAGRAGRRPRPCGGGTAGPDRGRRADRGRHARRASGAGEGCPGPGWVPSPWWFPSAWSESSGDATLGWRSVRGRQPGGIAMGRDVPALVFTREDRRRYRIKMQECLDTFAQMLREARFESERPQVGLEIELNLVDDRAEPTMRNNDALEVIADPAWSTELGRFNLEINVPPRRLTAGGPDSWESEIRTALNHAEKRAKSVGTHLIMTGILPTLRQEDVGESALSENPRYRLLNDQIFAARGEDLRIEVDGVDRLRTYADTITPEAACTSTQFHLQVYPEQFADHWNAAQSIAGVQVALAANSPFLFGRELWHETRVPLFEQATDTRPQEIKVQGVRPRVWFGERWINSVFDLFEENLRYFPALLPLCDEQDPAETLDRGDIPELGELTLHNGTIYRWNRPVYAIAHDKPHVRVENRVLPAGPTVADTLANGAFYYGLTRALAEEDRPVWSRMSFSAAEENLHTAARHGIEARLYWPGMGEVPVAELVLRRLLPLAHRGLERSGMDESWREPLLGIIEQRCVTGRNGAVWQKEMFHHIDATAHCGRHEALRRMTQQYIDYMHLNAPVHTWPVD